MVRQAVCGILLDAVIIGIFYTRLSRPSLRASTILFSDKAVVQTIEGKAYLLFQVCEMRKHQLVEAHVRCYAIRKAPSFSTQSMRLQRPDDELGGIPACSLEPLTSDFRISSAPCTSLSPPANPWPLLPPIRDYPQG